MRAVIVEIKNKTAAVLLADGRIEKIRDNGYAVGQVLDVTARQASARKRLVRQLASMVAVIAIGSASAFAYYTPYYYVSLDVNPSLEYSVNYFDRVLSVKVLDKDGILNEAELENLRNKKIEEAVVETVEQIREEGHLEPEAANGILIAVSGKNEEKAENLGVALQEAVKEKAEPGKPMEVETSSVKKEDIQEAKDLGVSAGKLRLVESLEESAEAGTIDKEEWLSKPVKEIMDAIKENKREEKNNKKEEKQSEKGQTEKGKKN